MPFWQDFASAWKHGAEPAGVNIEVLGFNSSGRWALPSPLFHPQGPLLQLESYMRKRKKV